MYAASPANATSFDFIQALRSVEFVYNSSAEKEKSMGFVAQEVKYAISNSAVPNISRLLCRIMNTPG